MNTFSDNMKKAISLAIYNGDLIFLHNDIVYQGNIDDEKTAYVEYCKSMATEPTDIGFNEWLETDGNPLCEYNDDSRYLVLTDDEADEKVSKYIRESLWAFNANFIAQCSSVDFSHRGIDELRKMQSRLFEDATEIVYAIIGGDDGFPDFVQAAIGADGRGHFLSPYDGEENEVNIYDITGKNEYFFIYRQ